MKKTIRDYNLENQRVLIRVDFNVPIENGIITEDKRIKESLPTIQYALDHKAKVILLSHLGRVEVNEDMQKYDLMPVAERLSDLLNCDVKFVNATSGNILEDAIQSLKSGQVLLMQNTRYEDLNGKRESKNDPALGSYWASLGDIFINDAFGTCHRSHASNVGIASHLPNGIGFLVEKELNAFQPILNHPVHPFTVILGGAKVEDKIEVIENLVTKADQILIGGGMAYTFLKASGIFVGDSLVDENHIDYCKNLMEKYPNKIILPIDSVNAKEINENADSMERFISDFEEKEIGLDIGHNTVKLFQQYISDSQTILWNGPVGMFELKPFSNGTKQICELLKKSKAFKIVGGGDTSAAMMRFGSSDWVNHISTGGGASLELLEGKKLPGIEIINEK